MNIEERVAKFESIRGNGPWKNEPNFKFYIDRGYSCLILRTYMGHLCGYVGLEEKTWGDYAMYPSYDVHGGIT